MIAASKKYCALLRPHRCRSQNERIDRSRSDDRCRSGASQPLKRTAAAQKKNEKQKKTKKQQKIFRWWSMWRNLRMQEVWNVGHPRIAVNPSTWPQWLRKNRFFSKKQKRVCAEKNEKKKNKIKKTMEQLTSIGRKLSNWRWLGENWATDVDWEKIVYWFCPSRRQDKEQANTTFNWKPLDKIRMVYMEDHCSRSAPSQPLSMLPALYRVRLQPRCTITCLGNKKYNTAGNPHTTARSSIIIEFKLYKIFHFCIFN